MGKWSADQGAPKAPRRSFRMESDLSGTNFQSANLAKVSFIGDYLYRTRFTGAILESVDFTGAFLQEVDFTGSNLAGAIFFSQDIEFAKPDIDIGIAQPTVADPTWYGTGAYVKGADFEGAKNLNEQNRIYLCRWGAVNVPGGCNDVQREELPEVDPYPGNSASACF